MKSGVATAQSHGIGTMAILNVEGSAVVDGETRDWSAVLKVMTLSTDQRGRAIWLGRERGRGI